MAQKVCFWKKLLKLFAFITHFLDMENAVGLARQALFIKKEILSKAIGLFYLFQHSIAPYDHIRESNGCLLYTSDAADE